jgi:hypothetical protein
MKGWYKWGAELDDAKWVLNALFQNEMRGNDDALGNTDFTSISEQFEWVTIYSNCILYLFLIIITQKMLTFLSMKYINFSSQ